MSDQKGLTRGILDVFCSCPMVRFVTAFLGFEPSQDERESVRRDQRDGEQSDVSGSQLGMRYEIIDSVELARRWVLPTSWVREHVRSRVTDPIPHIRFGRYVRFRWGSPELKGWLAEHMVNSRKRTQ